MPGFTTRFAPSPTGLLHRGHAYSALKAWSAAREADGRFILRIEDIDTTRCRPAFEADLLEDLSWLGLGWEEPVRRQSEHMADYHAALERLCDRGLAYRCFRTRREVAQEMASAPHGTAPAFRGAALSPTEESERLARGEPFAWRLSLEAARSELGSFTDLTFEEEGAGPEGQHGLITALPDLAGDIILARKDVGVAYHLAVTVDDALQGVTHIIRGEDLFEATHIQRLLQALLGLPTPVYRHHALLRGADGVRLAKRHNAETLQSLRTAGMKPGTLRKDLGFD
ncbi:MAG: tRNA glutamyl-Q(34) synthetase GluQRS [Alphaproteobacteria bacterium PA2]|nr:MAG: tRNA glutamyl-Q(34) synthetase GluQRS [Alphaproteobacteria bacterium PA2]